MVSEKCVQGHDRVRGTDIFTQRENLFFKRRQLPSKKFRNEKDVLFIQKQMPLQILTYAKELAAISFARLTIPKMNMSLDLQKKWD